ncbi:Sjogren's syndrome/scleroderma autoantigen 1 family protein [Methanothermococcus sp.]|uniref:Sjogren's syndrome/scleroderma autoantigen 1 family protein n=1 Tax=Methanothermococcus sp. TaxID=2614238 RepID=UPI0025D7AD68|nr:Sjogren's syndrome/scleroderma autoantigen 1 family protein [Methanothermococcus sp.]
MEYENANEEDNIIKVASKEMLKGSKMLGKHCKKCGFPLFEDKNGNIYCPNCNYNDHNYNKNDSLKKEVKEENVSCFKSSPSKENNKIIDKKINYLLKKLDSETDVSRIIEIGNAIELLIKLKNVCNIKIEDK